MGLSSQISSIIANQIGRAQGKIEAQVQTEAINLLSKFSNRCPSGDELAKIVKVRNNLLSSVNSFQKLLNKLKSIPPKLKAPINTAKRIIRLLKSSRVKLALGSRPSLSDYDTGGLASAKTAGYTTKQADRLYLTRKRLEDLEDDLSSINELIKNFDPGINSVRSILEGVNDNVVECAKQLKEEEQENLKKLLKEIRPLQSSNISEENIEEYSYRGSNGRDYILAIIEDNSIETSAPRRLAVAKDKIGIIVLRGQPSFSSDTKILLDELKFRIDNQLP